MNSVNSKYEKILDLSKNLKSKFIFDYDIYKSTWFRAGGKADIFCLVNDENELEIILNHIGGISYSIIGAGSNLLIRDRGYRGLIIKLGKSFNQLSIQDNKILAGASILDTNLAKFSYLHSIKNFEFLNSVVIYFHFMIKAPCPLLITVSLLGLISTFNLFFSSKEWPYSLNLFSINLSNAEASDDKNSDILMVSSS